MERHISLADVEAVVKNIYEKYRDLEVDGEPDPRLKNVDSSKFGIVVTLTDGRTVKVGDTEVLSPIGAIARIPLFTMLRMQKLKNPEKQHTDRRTLKTGETNKPADLPISANGILLVSKIEPKGDSDGKYNLIADTIENMVGSPLVFDDALYESMTKTNEAADVENRLAQARFELEDDAPLSIDIATRLASLQATASQIGMLGATLAADGRCPATGAYAFDGEVAPRVVAYMAAKGPHHLSKPWLIKSGLPAKSSFGGAMVGVFPGVMSIAAYSPVVNDDGVSVKAYKAIHHIMKHLDISVFESSQLVID